MCKLLKPCRKLLSSLRVYLWCTSQKLYIYNWVTVPGGSGVIPLGCKCLPAWFICIQQVPSIGKLVPFWCWWLRENHQREPGRERETIRWMLWASFNSSRRNLCCFEQAYVRLRRRCSYPSSAQGLCFTLSCTHTHTNSALTQFEWDHWGTLFGISTDRWWLACWRTTQQLQLLAGFFFQLW